MPLRQAGRIPGIVGRPVDAAHALLPNRREGGQIKRHLADGKKYGLPLGGDGGDNVFRKPTHVHGPALANSPEHRSDDTTAAIRLCRIDLMDCQSQFSATRPRQASCDMSISLRANDDNVGRSHHQRPRIAITMADRNPSTALSIVSHSEKTRNCAAFPRVVLSPGFAASRVIAAASFCVSPNGNTWPVTPSSCGSLAEPTRSLTIAGSPVAMASLTTSPHVPRSPTVDKSVRRHISSRYFVLVHETGKGHRKKPRVDVRTQELHLLAGSDDERMKPRAITLRKLRGVQKVQHTFLRDELANEYEAAGLVRNSPSGAQRGALGRSCSRRRNEPFIVHEMPCHDDARLGHAGAAIEIGVERPTARKASHKAK